VFNPSFSSDFIELELSYTVTIISECSFNNF
jgi:hypothetical protein